MRASSRPPDTSPTRRRSWTNSRTSRIPKPSRRSRHWVPSGLSRRRPGTCRADRPGPGPARGGRQNARCPDVGCCAVGSTWRELGPSRTSNRGARGSRLTAQAESCTHSHGGTGMSNPVRSRVSVFSTKVSGDSLTSSSAIIARTSCGEMSMPRTRRPTAQSPRIRQPGPRGHGRLGRRNSHRAGNPGGSVRCLTLWAGIRWWQCHCRKRRPASPSRCHFSCPSIALTYRRMIRSCLLVPPVTGVVFWLSVRLLTPLRGRPCRQGADAVQLLLLGWSELAGPVIDCAGCAATRPGCVLPGSRLVLGPLMTRGQVRGDSSQALRPPGSVSVPRGRVVPPAQAPRTCFFSMGS